VDEDAVMSDGVRPPTTDDIGAVNEEDGVLLEQHLVGEFARTRYTSHTTFTHFRAVVVFVIGSLICFGLLMMWVYSAVDAATGDAPRWHLVYALVPLVGGVAYFRYARRVFLGLWRWQ
jgi:hypothetical protein